MLPSQANDVAQLLMDGLRQQDVDELAAIGTDPGTALQNGLNHCGVLCFTAFFDGHPIAMFGAGPSEEIDVGIVWMLGTEGILAARRELITEAPVWIALLNRVYPTLTNYVDARNTVSIQWLQRMGFIFAGEEDDIYPTGSQRFRRFYRCASPPP